MAGPIPETRERSDREEKAPFPRSETIRAARTGPTPGSRWSSSSPARFTSMITRGETSEGGDRPPRRPGGALDRSSHGSSRATEVGPMPRTAIRSFEVRNTIPPSLAATIARAVLGPIPGSRSSSMTSARFGSIRSPSSSGRRARASSTAASRVASACSSRTPTPVAGAESSTRVKPQRRVLAASSRTAAHRSDVDSDSCIPNARSDLRAGPCQNGPTSVCP
jgi:hypothetical protein